MSARDTPRIPQAGNRGNKLARALKRLARENLQRFHDYTKVWLRHIGHSARRTYVKYASVGALCHLVTRPLALVIRPITLYRVIGIWPFSPIPYDRFKVWGREKLDPPVSGYTLSQPKNINPDNIPWQRLGWKPSENRMGYVVEVEKGFALSNGLMLDHRGRTIMGASHRYHSFRRSPLQKRVPSRSRMTSFQNQLTQWGPLTVKPWSTKLEVKYLSGTVLVLSNSHFDNYYHYIYNAICRLALVEDEMDSYHTIYVRNNRSYQKQYLSMLGLDGKQIVSADSAMPAGITADRLVMPCYARIGNDILDPKIINFLRKKLLPHADSSLSCSERIYISRRKTTHRHMTNEQELLPILTEYGFTVIYPEDYSVIEQISIFKFAKIIVSPHGSALANLLYCDPGTKLLDIFSGINVSALFLLAAALGIEYFYLSDIGGNKEQVKLTAAISIDPDIFRRAIESLCK